jgi:hypothetical protein
MFAACGGTTAGSPGSEAQCDEVQKACAALANTTCARHAGCASPAGAGRRFSSDAECRERWELACTSWVQAPDSKIGIADVAACSTQIEMAAGCGAVSSIFLSSSRLPWCLRIPGARNEGASCSSDAQCATSFCAVAEGIAACGVPFPEPAFENEPCSVSVPCAATLQCEKDQCGRATCEAAGCYDPYASCGGIDDPARLCPVGTECVNRSDRGTGQCAPYAMDGQACGSHAGPTCLFPARCIDGFCTLPEKRACIR